MANYRKSKSLHELIAEVRSAFEGYTLEDLVQSPMLQTEPKVMQALQAFVGENARGITSTQLRKLYDDIIGVKQATDVQMLRPQFAYFIAKQPTEEAKRIMLFADELANATTDDKFVLNFQKIMEAVVAFHRFYEVLNKRRSDHESALGDVRKALGGKLLNILKLEEEERIDAYFSKIEAFIKRIATSIKPTQLRRLYDAIKDLDSLEKLLALQPVLAYTAARQERQEAIQLVMWIMELCKEVGAKKMELSKLRKALEIIVSFHHYYHSNSSKGSKRYEKQLKNPSLEKFSKHIKYAFKDIITPEGYGDKQAAIQEAMKAAAIDLNSSQLRKLFDEIMDADSIHAIKQQRPLFLYAAGRQKRDVSKGLMLYLNEGIKQLSAGDLVKFKQFMEDIVAYHKFYEVTIN